MTLFLFILEIDLAAGYITETVARRSEKLSESKNIMRPSARLPTCNVVPEAHECDTPAIYHNGPRLRV